jgi:hypothetical protein
MKTKPSDDSRVLTTFFDQEWLLKELETVRALISPKMGLNCPGLNGDDVYAGWNHAAGRVLRLRLADSASFLK